MFNIHITLIRSFKLKFTTLSLSCEKMKIKQLSDNSQSFLRKHRILSADRKSLLYVSSVERSQQNGLSPVN